MPRIFSSSLAALAFVGVIVGCDDGPTADAQDDLDVADRHEQAFIQPVGDEVAVAPEIGEDEAVLARLDLPGGGTLTFLDEGLQVPGGGIGLLELAAPGVPSVLGAYKGLYRATPLEIFRALAPEVSPPERLLEDHELAFTRRGEAEETARALPGPLDLSTKLVPSADLPEVGCDNIAAANYHTAFQTMDGSLAGHGHGQDLTGSNTGVTGLSGERYLGVCLARWVSVTAKIEYEFTAGLWTLVAGSTTDIHIFQRIHYHSSGLQAQRYRVVVTNGEDDLYHIEGSW